MAIVFVKNYTTIEAFRGYGRYTVGVQACLGDDHAKCSPLIEKIVDVEGTTPQMSNFEVRDAGLKYVAATASWGEDPHATRYEIKWRKRQAGFSPGHAANVASGNDSFVIALPSAYEWIVRARACNVNLCGPAVTEAVNVDEIVKVSDVGEIQNLRVALKWTSLRGTAVWDAEPGATHYKVWYADTATGPMVPHISTVPNHNFSVPDHGAWDFLVQACNDDGCFAAASKLLEVYPPEE